ncbi:uncharacterized protein si:dkeyp-110g5.4 [Siniperca chuatsi]|uniref:uncharacterized protein si:dkeyp-110g5.4 n=1 Tax=Siniperca chuatsi TaxID=119488 RepID=UPI001CE1E2E2|nr:uncharacterized protein si:dkeyp-110g5.4 [Siniperca chuatsi]
MFEAGDERFTQGNTQSMDVLDRLEIYIPVEAEVKSIPLWSLTNSVLRRMGLPLSDSEGSRKLADSPEGIWICPAVIRTKGQKPASQTGNGGMSSLLRREIRAAPGPFRMSFVSSNRAAYKVLKDTMPGEKGSAHTPHSSLLPHGSAPATYKNAVVIYHGRIYLSIRNPNRIHSARETREPQPASQSSQSSIPSTSDLSSKSRKKRQPPLASVEPADKELQRKRQRVTLPQICPKQPKDLLTKPDSHSTADQELLNDNRPKKTQTTCRVSHSENRKDVMHKGRDVSSSRTPRSVPQSADSVHKVDSRRHEDAGGEQAAEEAPGLEPSWFQPQGEQEQEEEEEVANTDGEIQDLGGEEAERPDPNSDMDSNVQTDGGEPDRIVGVVEQSSSQTWTRREPHGAAGASTSLQFDFTELAQEEMIARMKAKLRQNEAALNNLHS